MRPMRPDTSTTQLGSDTSARPYFFVLPDGRLSSARYPNLAGLVEWLHGQPDGTKGYRRGCYGPVAEVRRGAVFLCLDCDRAVQHTNRKRGGK